MGNRQKKYNDAAFKLFVGKRLGYGATREVFEIRGDKSQVIKFARADSSDSLASNLLEVEIWHQFCHTKEGKRWLAEGKDFIPTGIAITQERLEVITSVHDRRLPKKIPRCLTDTKVQNWGADKKGNVKCLDYGSVLLLQNDPWKLKDAKWWSYDR